MRTVKHGRNRWQELKDVPKGVCNMCGGKGRYKETFTCQRPSTKVEGLQVRLKA